MIDPIIMKEASRFAFAIAAGVWIAFSLDFVRCIWKKHVIITDMFFWVMTGIGLFIFTEYLNQGILRSYLLLGWLTGWLIYQHIFRKFIKRIIFYSREMLKKIKKAVKISIGRR